MVQGLTALRNLDHRGAVGAEENTGDGAGILMQMPDRFLREVAEVELPPVGEYAAGMAFLPLAPAEADAVRTSIEGIAVEEGLRVLGWRDVPVNPDILGSMAREALPSFALLFVAAAGESRPRCANPASQREVPPPASNSTASPSVSASGPSTSSACTSRRCRRARSSTRAC